MHPIVTTQCRCGPTSESGGSARSAGGGTILGIRKWLVSGRKIGMWSRGGTASCDERGREESSGGRPGTRIHGIGEIWLVSGRYTGMLSRG
jgi:hypothetical protein